MKRVLLVVLTSATAFAAGCAANAQTLPPLDNSATLVSDVVRGDEGTLDESGLVEQRPALSPREIARVLYSQGFSTLSPPIRRGPAYVIAVIDPNGEDGRLTIDAFSGRIIRFRPIYGPGAMVLPDDVRGAYARLSPPRSIPYVPPRSAPAPRISANPAPRVTSKLASKVPGAAVTPRNPAVPNPVIPPAADKSAQKTAVAAAPAVNSSAKSSAETPAAATSPAPGKPTVELQATQPIPPVQGFE